MIMGVFWVFKVDCCFYFKEFYVKLFFFGKVFFVVLNYIIVFVIIIDEGVFKLSDGFYC